MHRFRVIQRKQISLKKFILYIIFQCLFFGQLLPRVTLMFTEQLALGPDITSTFRQIILKCPKFMKTWHNLSNIWHNLSNICHITLKICQIIENFCITSKILRISHSPKIITSKKIDILNTHLNLHNLRLINIQFENLNQQRIINRTKQSRNISIKAPNSLNQQTFFAS